jgi:glycosyltransferase involved in cell wall biosynthesis
MSATPVARGSGRSPLRVLLLVDKVVDTGGAERFVVGLAKHLPREQVQPWVCSTRHADPRTVRDLESLGVRHVNLGRQAKWDVHRFAPLLKLLRRERIDVVHSHMFGSNLWGVALGRGAGVPVILPHEHVWSYTGDPKRAWLDGQFIGRLCTRFLTVSEDTRRQMIDVEHVPRDKVIVMPTAYIPRPSTGGDLRAELGLSPGTPLVGVAAMLRPQKALETMLDAHKLVLEKVPDAHLVIAGDGPCLPDLLRYKDAIGSQDRVHFLGMRDDIESLLRQIDVGAMSSAWEGLPLFALECMAAQTPLVATAVGGLPDLVDSGKTGLLVAPGDPCALGEALTSVLLDRDRAEQLATNALRRLDEFRIETVARKFADLYLELYATSRRSRTRLR